jgi:hypothetical protein
MHLHEFCASRGRPQSSRMWGCENMEPNFLVRGYLQVVVNKEQKAGDGGDVGVIFKGG